MSYSGLDLTTVVFVRECATEVLRFSSTDVMAVIQLVKALLVAPLVRN
jgi:hypothetical protein